MAQRGELVHAPQGQEEPLGGAQGREVPRVGLQGLAVGLERAIRVGEALLAELAQLHQGGGALPGLLPRRGQLDQHLGQRLGLVLRPVQAGEGDERGEVGRFERQRLAVQADGLVGPREPPLLEVGCPQEELRCLDGVGGELGLEPEGRDHLLPVPRRGVEAAERAEGGGVGGEGGVELLPRLGCTAGVLQEVLEHLGSPLEERLPPPRAGGETRLLLEDGGELRGRARAFQRLVELAQGAGILRLELEHAAEPGGRRGGIPQPVLLEAGQAEEGLHLLRRRRSGAEVALEEAAEVLPSPLALEQPLQGRAGRQQQRVLGERGPVGLDRLGNAAEALLEQLGRLEGPLGALLGIAGRLGLRPVRRQGGVPVPGAGGEPPQGRQRRPVAGLHRQHLVAGAGGLVDALQHHLLELHPAELGGDGLVAVTRAVVRRVRGGQALQGVRGRLPLASRAAEASQLGEDARIVGGGRPGLLQRRDGLVAVAEPLLDARELEERARRGGAGRGAGVGAQDRGEVDEVAGAGGMEPGGAPDQGIVGAALEGPQGEGGGALQRARPLGDGGAREEVVRRAPPVLAVGRLGAALARLEERGAVAGGCRGLGRGEREGDGPGGERDGRLRTSSSVIGRGNRWARGERDLRAAHLGGEGLVAPLVAEAREGAQVGDEAWTGSEGAPVEPERRLGIDEALLVDAARLEEELGRPLRLPERGGLALVARGDGRPVHVVAGRRGDRVDAGGEAARDGVAFGRLAARPPLRGIALGHGWSRPRGTGYAAYSSNRSMRPARWRISSAPLVTASRSLPWSFTTWGAEGTPAWGGG